eukprot:9495526-Pyramimonas_sp.AAC.1
MATGGGGRCCSTACSKKSSNVSCSSPRIGHVHDLGTTGLHEKAARLRRHLLFSQAILTRCLALSRVEKNIFGTRGTHSRSRTRTVG